MHSGEICKQCGKIIPPHKGKARKFCSNDCFRAWHANPPEAIDSGEAAFYHFVCKYCGKEFTVYGNSKRIYCSHECYIKSRFGTKEERAEKAALEKSIRLIESEMPENCLHCPYYLESSGRI